MKCGCTKTLRVQSCLAEGCESRGGSLRPGSHVVKMTAVAVSLACTLSLAFAFHAHTSKSSVASTTPPNQGCVNQGIDRRVAAPIVCWAQRHLSWKSEHEPHFVLIGRPERTSIGLAWPPYVVYNSPDGSGRWRMFRVGFRYDRSWRGYIFPTVAWKHVSSPLRY